MKAFIVDKGYYISDWLFGCSGGDDFDCRAFRIIVPEMNLVIEPRNVYEIGDLSFRDDPGLCHCVNWEESHHVKPIDIPKDIILDIMDKIRAEKRMRKANEFIKEAFTSVVTEDWRKHNK